MTARALQGAAMFPARQEGEEIEAGRAGMPAEARHHEHTVGSVTVEQAVAILATATRAGLHSLSGDNPDHRLMTLAAFLYHLCQVEPERREKMAAILDGVKEAVTALAERAS